MREEEVALTCPYCWPPTSHPVELCERQQVYVEDGPLCCPLPGITRTVGGGERAAIEVERRQ